jgi:hypothetical protein
MALQSRNTPSKDALPPAAANDPPSGTPRGWLTTPFKEELKEDAATTSMLVDREALTESFSPSRASYPGVVSGPLVGSLSGRTNASPCASPEASPAGAQQSSVEVAELVARALARNESEIPRQQSAIPPTRSRKAHTPPIPTLPSPQSLSGKWEVAGCTTGSPGPVGCPKLPWGGVLGLYLVPNVSSPTMATQEGCRAHHSIAVFITSFVANF